jgi:hypothetical protein
MGGGVGVRSGGVCRDGDMDELEGVTGRGVAGGGGRGWEGGVAGKGAAGKGIIGEGGNDSSSSVPDGGVGGQGDEATRGGQIGKVGVACSVEGNGGRVMSCRRGERRRLAPTSPSLNSLIMHCLFTAFCMRFAGVVYSSEVTVLW